MTDSRKSVTFLPNKGLLPAATIEGREWWLWGFALLITIALTVAIVALVYPGLNIPVGPEQSDLKDWVRALAALVLLFDLYTIHQRLQLSRTRKQLAERSQLFELITENAADMIAVVDLDGRRVYNSPAYQRILGYSAEELLSSSSFDQVHPEDRSRVIAAAEKARLAGIGEQLEYRIRHKDGSWRILESTASPVRNAKGEIEKLVIINRDISDRRKAEELLEYNALHDHLTHLPNRTHLLRQLERSMAFARRHEGYLFAVLFLDLDAFTLINESLGHDIGDQLLIQLGNRLQTSIRGLDVVARGCHDRITSDDERNEPGIARLGGDEYAVLLDDIRHPSDAVRVATRLQAAISTPFLIAGHDLALSFSIGIALNRASYGSAQELLRDAEIAMHRAKQVGKSQCQVFDPAMQAQAIKRLQTEAELRKALAGNEFRVYYQPIVSLDSGQVVGFEALSRWHRPDRVVLPGEFIEIADETGLIIPINRHLLLESCLNLKEWQKKSRSEHPLFLSINVPPKQFFDPNLTGEIASTLRQTGVDSTALELEIVETVVMSTAATSNRILQQLRDLGTRLCIDDFGTGYSSLSRLQELPVQTLKIDRSFIHRIEQNLATRETVRTIIQLAHAIGLRVVAEGVERVEQRDLLKALGCDYAQGFYFLKPAPASAIEEFLRSASVSTMTSSLTACVDQPANHIFPRESTSGPR